MHLSCTQKTCSQHWVYHNSWIQLSENFDQIIGAWVCLNHWLADEKWILSFNSTNQCEHQRASADSSGMIWLSWQFSSNALLAQGGASTQQSFEIQYVYQLNQLCYGYLSPWHPHDISIIYHRLAGHCPLPLFCSSASFTWLLAFPL